MTKDENSLIEILAWINTEYENLITFKKERKGKYAII